MLIIQKPAEGMRKEVYDASEDIALLVDLLFLDDEPNRTQIDEIVVRVISNVREGTDVVQAVPADFRLQAAIHSLTTATALTVDKEVVYPDEMEEEEGGEEDPTRPVQD